MRPFCLRLIDTNDRDFLLKVYASTRAAELAQTDWDESTKAAFVGMQFEAQHAHYMQHYDSSRFCIVEIEGQPVGRFYVQRGQDEIRVVDIALLPEHQNLGIGGVLMRQLLLEAQSAGLPVTIHVEQFNRALTFYQRLGFSVAQLNGVYFLMRWEPVTNTVGAFSIPVMQASQSFSSCAHLNT